MRNYIVGSWNNADEFDYSGEQIGDRKRPSHMIGDSANLAAYGDVLPKKSKAKEKSVASLLIPQEATLDKLDKLEIKLHKEYKEHAIEEEEYVQLMHALKLKRERAWKSLCKARGIVADNSQEETGYDSYEYDRGFVGHEQREETSNTADFSNETSCSDLNLNTFLEAFIKGSVIAYCSMPNFIKSAIKLALFVWCAILVLHKLN